LLLDLYRGELAPSIDLQGLEHVISVTHAPITSQPSTSTSVMPMSIVDSTPSTSTGALPLVHLRVHGIKMLKSSSAGRQPYVTLTPSGPNFDIVLRRSKEPAPEQWKRATRVQKRKSKGEGGAQAKKRSKNWDVDEMGDKVGRVHMETQDLSKLQSRKMKGLKASSDKED